MINALLLFSSHWNVILEANPSAALSGQNIVLRCLVHGSRPRGPSTHILYRDGKKIKQGNRYRYTMKKVKGGQEGKYHCTLTIGKTMSVSPQITITISGIQHIPELERAPTRFENKKESDEGRVTYATLDLTTKSESVDVVEIARGNTLTSTGQILT
ncbi:hypothetical protein scyTo_0014201 [Scyliorhinus torazame]|uniref:Immunoglobulin domain-containing protein n=1 Tax=Scyliorhinus torazame TaxID=75743 RepID=A0A401NID6_SCYTO|nr:hypothetical protein [Scyliorhinus torazame]